MWVFLGGPGGRWGWRRKGESLAAHCYGALVTVEVIADIPHFCLSVSSLLRALWFCFGGATASHWTSVWQQSIEVPAFPGPIKYMPPSSQSWQRCRETTEPHHPKGSSLQRSFLKSSHQDPQSRSGSCPSEVQASSPLQLWELTPILPVVSLLPKWASVGFCWLQPQTLWRRVHQHEGLGAGGNGLAWETESSGWDTLKVEYLREEEGGTSGAPVLWNFA